MTGHMNVADPGSPEALSADDFEATMIDRRDAHSPLVKSAGRLERYTPATRHKGTGITLHQTACNMGERIGRYDTIGANFAVLRSGRVLRMADIDKLIYHGNAWNNLCAGIEIDGLYAGIEDDPDTAQDEALRSTWDDPSTPTRELPMKVTPQAMRSTRQLVRWIVIDALRRGWTIRVLCAHRQSSKDRRNDPGQAIWQEVALPLHAELGLMDGGSGFQVGGYPIPTQWNPQYVGFPY